MLVQHPRKEMMIEYNGGKPRIPVSLSIGYALNDQKAPNLRHLFREDIEPDNLTIPLYRTIKD
ncbi:MAG: hypothetical protein K9J48_01375 [Desulfohalobiaceae bacterium]|nr:hypothetical protein [Desulfohalobiaceae bacterium]